MVVIVCLGLAACADQYTEEIVVVQELQAKVDSAEQVLMSLDTAKMREVGASVPRDLQYLQSIYPDTMQIETANMLSIYRRLIKKVAETREQWDAVQENIIYARDQLWRLEENLKINKWEKSEGIGYVKDETNATYMLMEQIDIVMLGAEQTITTYDSLKPLVNELITRIESTAQQ